MAQFYKIGSKGLEVARIQSALNATGADPPLSTDGVYGAQTAAAVRKFQARNKLKVDGTVGPMTLGALVPFQVLTVSVKAQVVVPASPQPVIPKDTNPPTIPPQEMPRLQVPNPGGGRWIKQEQNALQLTGWPGSRGGVWSGVITLGFVYQTKPEGRHFELSPLVQFAVNSSSPTLTLSGGGQVTWADIYAPGRWHILSPFAQAMVYDQGSFGMQLSAGNQFSYEIIENRLSIFAQDNALYSLDFKSGRSSWSNQGLIGAFVNF